MLMLLFLSIAACLVAVMVITAIITEQIKRDINNNSKMQEILDDITLMHADIVEYHAKLIKQTGHLEDNSSFSGSKLALIETRLTTIEKILLDAAPVLQPMTQAHSARRTTSLEDANKEAFDRMSKDDDRRRGSRFNPFGEDNRRG